MCVGDPVVVVGGGNSAGQAAMFLSRHALHVSLLIRGSISGRTCRATSSTRSRRTRASPCSRNTEVRELVGDQGELQSLVVENNQTAGAQLAPVPRALRLHRRGAVHAVARRRDRARRERLHPDGHRSPGGRARAAALRDEPRGRVRRRRRALRLDQAGRVGGRRGLDGRPPGARAPGPLMPPAVGNRPIRMMEAGACGGTVSERC